jgi:hypothetical protein
MIDQFEDLMGIVIETGYAPLDKKLNSHICYKGGGGQTTTSESGVPKEFRPYVERGLSEAEKLRGEGKFAYVAGLTPEQREAQAKQLELGRTTLPGIAEESAAARGEMGRASRGEGIYGAEAYTDVARQMEPQLQQIAQMTRGAGQTQASLGGGLGSARQQSLVERGVLDKTLEATAQEVAAQREGRMGAAKGVISTGSDVGAQYGTGAAAIERVGKALQEQEQREGDKDYQSIQRFFGLLGSPAVGQETKSTTSGGGK